MNARARPPRILPRDLPPVPTQMDGAACTAPDEDPEDWFGDPNSPPGMAARTTCLHDCPARGKCLAYVMALEPQPPGIFAGLTEPERRRLAPRYRRRN